MQEKLQQLFARLGELENELGKSDASSDLKRFRELSKEHSYISSLKEAHEAFLSCERGLESTIAMRKDETDPEFLLVIEEDVKALEAKLPVLKQAFEFLLIPPDPDDDANTILELRAGTGGDEASLFVADSARMYALFCDDRGWKYECLSCAKSEVGGFKEYIMAISGTGAFRTLKHEGGTHRVQRVPATEAQGRIHTSAITVAVLKEPEEEEFVLDEKELRIDTQRASGAGGQHVNTTDSAVRITHLPSGLIVYCQDEKSQIKNRERAMRVMKARLAELKTKEAEAARASDRAKQVGSGDRSERIRTYNFPQNRLTDHRIGLTVYNLDSVMHGKLHEVTDALIAHFRAEKLRI